MGALPPAFYKLWVAFFGRTWYTIVNLLMQRGFGMAQFRNKKPFGKYTPFICFLLLIAGLEFFVLAGFLLTGRQETPPVLSVSGEPDTEMPDWLEPAEPAEKEKPAGEATGPEILAGKRIITHGLGAVGERTVLNCLEGFQEMYAKGVRVFEADLRLTSDQKVVLRHDWRKGWQREVRETSIPTLEEFLNTPILGKYTPLSFKDLLLLLEEYPDVCIITDSKFMEAEFVRLQFDAMLADARELGLSYLLDRFVVQIYSPLMYQVTDSIHHFKGYIYTLYLEGFDGTEDTFRRKAAFCAENGILGITIAAELWDSVYAQIGEEYGLAVYTHTVNDLEQAKMLLDSGASGIYTDSLTPGDLEAPAAAGDDTEKGDV